MEKKSFNTHEIWIKFSWYVNSHFNTVAKRALFTFIWNSMFRVLTKMESGVKCSFRGTNPCLHTTIHCGVFTRTVYMYVCINSYSSDCNGTRNIQSHNTPTHSSHIAEKSISPELMVRHCSFFFTSPDSNGEQFFQHEIELNTFSGCLSWDIYRNQCWFVCKTLPHENSRSAPSWTIYQKISLPISSRGSD